VNVRLPDGTQTSIVAIEAPRNVDDQIQSWDCAFKDLNTSDYVVGQVWGRLGAMYFLGDQVRARMDCPATMRAVRGLYQKWPGTLAKLIEDKANGSAVVQFLQNEIPGIIPVNPAGGKVARAAAVSPLLEAGNVYLPHPEYAPWVNDFVEECAAFPNGAHDDQVDAMTQALLRWNTPHEEYAEIQVCEPVRISPY
jgi:predicted phage terminase large subunit-like protein